MISYDKLQTCHGNVICVTDLTRSVALCDHYNWARRCLDDPSLRGKNYTKPRLGENENPLDWLENLWKIYGKSMEHLQCATWKPSISHESYG